MLCRWRMRMFLISWWLKLHWSRYVLSFHFVTTVSETESHDMIGLGSCKEERNVHCWIVLCTATDEWIFSSRPFICMSIGERTEGAFFVIEDCCPSAWFSLFIRGVGLIKVLTDKIITAGRTKRQGFDLFSMFPYLLIRFIEKSLVHNSSNNNNLSHSHLRMAPGQPTQSGNTRSTQPHDPSYQTNNP